MRVLNSTAKLICCWKINREICQGSSAGESARLIPVRSRVRISLSPLNRDKTVSIQKRKAKHSGGNAENREAISRSNLRSKLYGTLKTEH